MSISCSTPKVPAPQSTITTRTWHDQCCRACFRLCQGRRGLISLLPCHHFGVWHPQQLQQGHSMSSLAGPNYNCSKAGGGWSACYRVIISALGTFDSCSSAFHSVQRSSSLPEGGQCVISLLVDGSQDVGRLGILGCCVRPVSIHHQAGCNFKGCLALC